MKRMELLSGAFEAVSPCPPESARRSKKKNYAEALSRELAQAFANALRPSFVGIRPDEEGKYQESKARTVKGFKKLDVNYSTPELGLGLGVSIKTLNFRDAGSGRYTKNFTRVDNELRAEAVDYHSRQPFSVLVGVLFLPIDSCDDGTKTHSSFGQAVRVLRYRAGRQDWEDSPDLFERFWIGLYDLDKMQANLDDSEGCIFFDVMRNPPRRRRPYREEWEAFATVLKRIKATYDSRNAVNFEWADD